MNIYRSLKLVYPFAGHAIPSKRKSRKQNSRQSTVQILGSGEIDNHERAKEAINPTTKNFMIDVLLAFAFFLHFVPLDFVLNACNEKFILKQQKQKLNLCKRLGKLSKACIFNLFYPDFAAAHIRSDYSNSNNHEVHNSSM